MCLCSEIPGWISCDPKRPLGPPCEDHLSFLLPFWKFLLPGVELDVEEFISDAFKIVYTFPAPLISIFLPAQGWGQARPMKQ